MQGIRRESKSDLTAAGAAIAWLGISNWPAMCRSPSRLTDRDGVGEGRGRNIGGHGMDAALCDTRAALDALLGQLKRRRTPCCLFLARWPQQMAWRRRFSVEGANHDTVRATASLAA